MPERKLGSKNAIDEITGQPSKAGKLIFTSKELTTPEVEITDVLVNLDYRYYHTGTSIGHILVWKFDNSKK